jgi:hypothetical protein
MNNKFDELTKSMAQAVTRRAALKKLGLAAVAAIAARLGVGGASAAPQPPGYCQVQEEQTTDYIFYTGICVDPTTCQQGTSSHCPATKVNPRHARLVLDSCDHPNGYLSYFDTNKPCSF